MVSFRAHVAVLVAIESLIPLPRRVFWVQACAILLGPAICCAAQTGTTTLDRWFAAQAQVETWSADFIQTRALKTLTEPLTTPGRVWFVAPHGFRWELGQPAQTLAIRDPTQMLVIYPRLKRAERYLLSAGNAGPWNDVLTLFDAGFPRSRDQLERQFKLLDHAAEEQGMYKLILEPLAPAARRVIAQLRIEFSPAELLLTATEFQLADGSILRNNFSNVVVNPKVDPALMKPQIDSAYTITEPLRQRAR